MGRRRRRQFSPEFKVEALRLVAQSQDSIAKIARDLGLSRMTLRNWVAKAARPAPKDALTADERAELVQLRRENRQLQMERDILKKATAFFARQSE
jgi:transposase-like protein